MRPEVIWRDMRPLPAVAPWNKGRRSYTWEQRRDHYAALPKTPIVITAELVTPILHAERESTHLDGVLSSAALTSHPHASSYEQAAVIPLPIELAWVSPQGLPLWACTPLVPAGNGIVTREYWHKRYPSHRAEFGDRLNAVTSAGRWREYRVPVQAHQIDRLTAMAIGNADAVKELLSVVTHIGKKSSIGYGRVGRWTVSVGAHAINDVLAARAVPIEAMGSGSQPRSVAPLRGWTPPYWYAPWWAECSVPE